MWQFTSWRPRRAEERRSSKTKSAHTLQPIGSSWLTKYFVGGVRSALSKQQAHACIICFEIACSTSERQSFFTVTSSSENVNEVRCCARVQILIKNCTHVMTTQDPISPCQQGWLATHLCRLQLQIVILQGAVGGTSVSSCEKEVPFSLHALLIFLSEKDTAIQPVWCNAISLAISSLL